jgi:hypothetical protein
MNRFLAPLLCLSLNRPGCSCTPVDILNIVSGFLIGGSAAFAGDSVCLVWRSFSSLLILFLSLCVDLSGLVRLRGGSRNWVSYNSLSKPFKVI